MKRTLGAGAAIAAASALFGSAPASAATLVGDTIQCAAVGYTCSATTAVVGSGAEFKLTQAGTDFLSFDFASGSLSITPLASFFGDVGSSVTFTDLTHAFSSAGYLTPPPANFSFTWGSGGSLILNLGRVVFPTSPATSIALDTVVAGVPEPATWAMLLLGFFGIGSAVRSRRSRARALAG